MKFYILFLCLIVRCSSVSKLRLGIQIFQDVLDIYNLVKDGVNLVEMISNGSQNDTQVILDNLQVVIRNIDKFSTKQDDMFNFMQNDLAARVRFDSELKDLREKLNKIDYEYKRIIKYADAENKFEKYTLEDAARTVVTHDPDSVLSLLEQVHTFFNPKQEGLLHTNITSVFLKMADEMDKDSICNFNESPQQLIIQLYKTAITTELKCFTLINLSYKILNLYGHGNFTTEKADLTKQYLQRTDIIEELLRNYSKTSRKLWLCDPKMFVKDENYLEVTELLQGHIQNELDLNKEGTCWANCAAYPMSKPKKCRSDLNYYCNEQRRCNGHLYGCRFVTSSAKVCHAKNDTNRRYDFIDFDEGLVYGNKNGRCQGHVAEISSWWRWLFWHCSYCICLCDEQSSTSDRFINLREVKTNIKENKVATGLRFVKRNRVIHLQIQEGELGAMGQIKTKSIKWVPVQDYWITDKNVKSGVDFHTMTFVERALDLDGLEANNANEVLTGVRFKMVDRHLNFQILVTQFDIVSGRLVPNKSYWKNNIFTNRKKINLDNRDIPTRTKSSKPDNRRNMYLEFTHSDFNRDAAQSTIPFFDSQDVVSNTPVALSGAGIYYKGDYRYGGFIAPKVFTYNYLNEAYQNGLYA